MPKRAFMFHGLFEKHGPEVWALCNHAPVYAAGSDEDNALVHMSEALDVYLRMLVEHDQVEQAISAGNLIVVKDFRASDIFQVEETDPRPPLRIVESGDAATRIVKHDDAAFSIAKDPDNMAA